jgi:Golgi SNAP receptor complex protein 1
VYINLLDNEETALSKDIQRIISQINELINTKMAPSSECTGKAQHALLVKRYREIVFDCNAEYSKTCASIVRRRKARNSIS